MAKETFRLNYSLAIYEKDLRPTTKRGSPLPQILAVEGFSLEKLLRSFKSNDFRINESNSSKIVDYKFGREREETPCHRAEVPLMTEIQLDKGTAIIQGYKFWGGIADKCSFDISIKQDVDPERFIEYNPMIWALTIPHLPMSIHKSQSIDEIIENFRRAVKECYIKHEVIPRGMSVNPYVPHF